MAKKIPKKVKELLREAGVELRNIYSNRLKEIVLYGSYARGDYSSGSDVDILLILEESSELAAERERYFPIVSRISLKYDTVLSVIPFDYQTYMTKKSPLILNAHREGVLI